MRHGTLRITLSILTITHTVVAIFFDLGSEPQLAVIESFRVDPRRFPPWMSSIQLALSHICGGSLISSRFVLTAAHCTSNSHTKKPFKPTQLQVLLRADSLSNWGENGVLVDVAKIHTHDLYDPQDPNLDYDIALLELAQPAFNRTFPPNTTTDQLVIKLPPADFLYSDLIGARLRIFGWGDVRGGADLDARVATDVLMSSTVEYVSQEECERIYSTGRYRPTNFVMCTNSTGRDVCQGDSGGPLLLETDNDEGGVDHMLIGVISLSSWG